MQPLRRANPPHDYRAELFELIRARSFGRGKIMLASGRESDFYFDLRPTTIHPAGATCVGELICDALEGTNAEFVGGLEAGAIPIATAVAIASHRRGGTLQAFFVRKKLKDHGAKKMIEGLPKGESLKGKNVVVLEDTTTTGGSSMQAVNVLREEGANIVCVLTIVDRLEGAKENFAAEGLELRAIYTADEFLKALHSVRWPRSGPRRMAIARRRRFEARNRSLRSAVTSTSHKRLDPGLRAAQDQRVDVVRALVGVHRFEIAHHAHHVEFVRDAVAAVHVARERARCRAPCRSCCASSARSRPAPRCAPPACGRGAARRAARA